MGFRFADAFGSQIGEHVVRTFADHAEHIPGICLRADRLVADSIVCFVPVIDEHSLPAGPKDLLEMRQTLLGTVATADVLDDFDDLHFLMERVRREPHDRAIVLARLTFSVFINTGIRPARSVAIGSNLLQLFDHSLHGRKLHAGIQGQQ